MNAESNIKNISERHNMEFYRNSPVLMDKSIDC